MKLFGRKKQTGRQPHLGQEEQGYVFRRSRTLTGTTSGNVATSAQQRSQLKTPRLKTHELHQLRRRVLHLLLGSVVCAAILTLVIANYIGAMTLRYPQAGRTPDAAAYQKTLLGYFAKHPFERFGFSVNQAQLDTYMRQAHAEILAMDVHKNWYGGDVRFHITFRKPLLVWEVDSQRFYVDEKGIAFGYDHFAGKYVAVNDQSGVSSTSGSAVASKRFISFLGKMVGAVNAGGKGSVAAVIIPPSTREIDLKVQGREYLVKTHTDRDPLQQAEDIVRALSWFDQKKITPQYVDVRVANKAFYK